MLHDIVKQELAKKQKGSPFRRFKHTAKILFLKYSERFIRNPTQMPFPCFACFSSIYIENDGTVYSCPVLYKSLGNIRKESFDSIWESDGINKTRVFIKEGKCSCYTNCNMIPSLVFNKFPEIIYTMIRGGSQRPRQAK